MSREAALGGRQRVVALLGLLALLGMAILLLVRDDAGRSIADGVELSEENPFAFEPRRAAEFLERGAHGLSHPLYTLSPGGVEATAERTLRFEHEIATAARARGVDPLTLEAVVFLESAGRPEVIAGDDPEAASGLAQILPGTATDLLRMSVDLPRSKRLTREIARLERRAADAGRAKRRVALERRARELAAERRRVDERFDPEAALRGAARYLAIGQEHFGREGMAVASYHMGIGNLDGVIEAYLAPDPVTGTSAETVAEHGLSYPQLYFDSSPARNPRTYARLAELGDDSRHYLFRVEAAREAIRLYREDRHELRRLAALHGNKASREEVLRPPAETERFDGPEELQDAYDDDELVGLRLDAPELGYRVADEMGELAGDVGAEPALYRGLRPEALAAVVHLADMMRDFTGRRPSLTLTSTVRDPPYQEALRGTNPQATDEYSLHTTGFAFDVARDLPGPTEEALVAALERLRALNVLDWVYEPGALHVTVGPEAGRLLAD